MRKVATREDRPFATRTSHKDFGNKPDQVMIAQLNPKERERERDREIQGDIRREIVRSQVINAKVDCK